MSIKTSFTIILIAALIIWSFIYTGFSIGDLMIGIPQIGAFFGQMVPPDWSYLDQITKPMLDTIRMAIVGTFLGSIVSIPVALYVQATSFKLNGLLFQHDLFSILYVQFQTYF